ncbi:hypothetical protein jbd68_62 [Pseudomonas phage JBD68]|nr:hypothetical protein jbd68_62 [Pseudomonas phage JBD68]
MRLASVGRALPWLVRDEVVSVVGGGVGGGSGVLAARSRDRPA